MLVGGARIMRWPRNAVQRIGGTDDVLNRQRMEETPRGIGLLGSESVPADHPLLLLLVDIAARHDVPIDLHFDPVLEKMARPDWAPSTNPAVLPANFPAFERLLAHNRVLPSCTTKSLGVTVRNFQGWRRRQRILAG